MATTTPAPGYFGNSTDGFGGGNGMTKIREMSLREEVVGGER